VVIKWQNDVVVEGKKISGIIASVSDLDKEQMTIDITSSTLFRFFM
jgi:biotin-(acetyl-CoA carboxylase) ligase